QNGTCGVVERSVTILLVDDDLELCELVAFGFARQHITVVARHNGPDALAALPTLDIDVVVADLDLPGIHGFDLLQRTVVNRSAVPVIVLTGGGDFQPAVAAMRAGAYDFCTKPVDLAALALAIKRAAEKRALRAEVSRLRRVVAEARRFEHLVGASAAMQQ